MKNKYLRVFEKTVLRNILEPKRKEEPKADQTEYRGSS
jgi:hypothetical protein